MKKPLGMGVFSSKTLKNDNLDDDLKAH